MIDKIISHLKNSNGYCYLLVDPLKPLSDFNALALANIKEAVSDDEIQVVLRSDLYYEPKKCPHLVLIAKPDQEIDREIIEMIWLQWQREKSLYKHYILAIISSEYSKEELAAQLVSYGQQLGQITKPTSQYFLPFFEHIRLQLLKESLLHDSAVNLSFNFANLCLYMNYYGELEIIKNQTPLLDSSLEALFFEQALLNQQDPYTIFLVTRLWKKYAETLPKQALLKTAKVVKQANAIGLTDELDIMTFSFYSLLSGKNLMEYPAFVDKVQLARKTPNVLEYQFRQLRAEDWQAIGIEIEEKNKK